MSKRTRPGDRLVEEWCALCQSFRFVEDGKFSAHPVGGATGGAFVWCAGSLSTPADVDRLVLDQEG